MIQLKDVENVVKFTVQVVHRVLGQNLVQNVMQMKERPLATLSDFFKYVMKSKITHTNIVLLLFFLVLSCNAFGQIGNKKQITVKTGIFVKNLSINTAEGTFYTDFYWWCKVPLSVEKTKADEYARLEFVNSRSEVENDITEKKITPEFYYYTGYCRGNFDYITNYKNYPVDTQNISLIIESLNLEEETVVLVPDNDSYQDDFSYGINNKIELPEFKIISSGFKKNSQVYKTNFGDPKLGKTVQFSRLNYEVKIKRDSLSYLLKIIIPCFLLSLIAYLVFFIPAERLDVAVGCTVTALLAAIAVQLTTTGDIPRTGYITNSDKIYYLFYTLICLALIQTVYTYNLEINNNFKLSKKMEKIGRISFPIFLILGLLIILL